MASLEIPRAEDLGVEKTPNKDTLSDYESQKKICLEEMSKISKDKASVAVNLNHIPNERLVSELQEKGFLIKYKLNYESDKTPKITCRMRIINPKLLVNSPQVDDFLDNLSANLKSFGCNSGEGEEAIEKLFGKFFVGL